MTTSPRRPRTSDGIANTGRSRSHGLSIPSSTAVITAPTPNPMELNSMLMTLQPAQSTSWLMTRSLSA